MVQIIRVKIFRVDKFSRFHSILESFLRKIRVLNFHGWSQPRNYFNSEIFPIYGSLEKLSWLQRGGFHGVVPMVLAVCGGTTFEAHLSKVC